MIARKIPAPIALMLGLLGLAGCDEAADIVGKAADKGRSDVPEEARPSLPPETIDALRQRAQGQNFN